LTNLVSCSRIVERDVQNLEVGSEAAHDAIRLLCSGSREFVFDLSLGMVLRGEGVERYWA